MVKQKADPPKKLRKSPEVRAAEYQRYKDKRAARADQALQVSLRTPVLPAHPPSYRFPGQE